MIGKSQRETEIPLTVADFSERAHGLCCELSSIL
jgi:hypothetical protein